MAGERNYLRVPPDSTGKRLRLKHAAQIAYTGKLGGYMWKIGEHYQLVTGSGNWTVHVHGYYEETSTTGILEVHYSKSATYTNLNPAAGNTIVDPSTGTAVATVSSATEVYINTQNIIGYDNPENGLNVDTFGAANVRFSEGIPQLDSFGKLRVSGATLLGEYIFSSNTLPDLFSGTTHGGGSITWDNDTRAAVLTTTTTSTSHASYTSNTYHHYFPGSSQLFIGTVLVGDTGKAGVTREWGQFDDKNGYMFKLDGTTLGVNIRSNAGGSIVDNFIPQNSWNRDKADGTGPSAMDLDITKDNIYWIDVQWLGAGRIRFGTYDKGQRVVLHEYYHGNTSILPVTAMGNLPVCLYQHNSTTVASPSVLKAWCLALWTESDIDVRTTAKTALHSFNKTITANNSYEYVGTLSPKTLLPNNQPNRSLYWPVEVEVMAFDTVTGNPALVELQILAEPVLSNLSWQSNESSTVVDYDTGGTWHGGGRPISKVFVQGNKSVDATRNYDNMQYGAFKNFAEDGGTVTQPISGITNAATAVVTLSGPRTYFREGQSIEISSVGGMTQVNGNTYYCKPVSTTSVALFTDSGLTTPLNSSGFGTYTSGGVGMGLYGTKFLFTLVTKKYFGTNPVQVIAKVSWKEVIQ